jgi:hypothetical protein
MDAMSGEAGSPLTVAPEEARLSLPPGEHGTGTRGNRREALYAAIG